MPAETKIQTQAEAEEKMVDLPSEGTAVDVEIKDAPTVVTSDDDKTIDVGEKEVVAASEAEVEDYGKKVQSRIDKLTKKFSSPDLDNLPVFTGGLIGYFSYESFKYVEPKLNYKPSDTPLISLCECNELIVFDNFKGTFSIIVNTQNKTLEAHIEPTHTDKHIQANEQTNKRFPQSF